MVSVITADLCKENTDQRRVREKSGGAGIVLVIVVNSLPPLLCLNDNVNNP